MTPTTPDPTFSSTDLSQLFHGLAQMSERAVEWGILAVFVWLALCVVFMYHTRRKDRQLQKYLDRLEQDAERQRQDYAYHDSPR